MSLSGKRTLALERPKSKTKSSTNKKRPRLTFPRPRRFCFSGSPPPVLPELDAALNSELLPGCAAHLCHHRQTCQSDTQKIQVLRLHAIVTCDAEETLPEVQKHRPAEWQIPDIDALP